MSHLPARGIAFQVLALPLQRSTTNLTCNRTILTRVEDVLDTAHWDAWVHEVRAMLYERGPFMILGHRDWSSA